MNPGSGTTNDGEAVAVKSRTVGRHPIAVCTGLLNGLGLIAIALATLVAGFANYHWVGDLFVHFRVQYALLALAGSAIASVTNTRKAMILGLGCLLINGWPLVPYYSWSNSTATGGRISCSLLHQNVLSTNQQYSQVVELIREQDPDIVILQETNASWEQGLSGLFVDYPHRHFEPQPGNFGMAVLSKKPWQLLEVVRVPPLQLPSLVVEFDLAEGDGEVPAQSLRLVATHPIPPMEATRWRARNRQLLAMADLVDQEQMTLMVGDFNLTPWSPWFGRVIRRGGLRDAGLGFGIMPTWSIFSNGNDFATALGGIRIDHVLVNSHVVVRDHEVTTDVGSDHRGIMVEFSPALQHE